MFISQRARKTFPAETPLPGSHENSLKRTTKLQNTTLKGSQEASENIKKAVLGWNKLQQAKRIKHIRIFQLRNPVKMEKKIMKRGLRKPPQTLAATAKRFASTAKKCLGSGER